MNFHFSPIGFVQSIRSQTEDDFWGEEQACICLTESFTAEAFEGVSDFSHVEIFFVFHEVDLSKIVMGARHPRNNKTGRRWVFLRSAGRIDPIALGALFAELSK